MLWQLYIDKPRTSSPEQATPHCRSHPGSGVTDRDNGFLLGRTRVSLTSTHDGRASTFAGSDDSKLCFCSGCDQY